MSERVRMCVCNVLGFHFLSLAVGPIGLLFTVGPVGLSFAAGPVGLLFAVGLSFAVGPSWSHRWVGGCFMRTIHPSTRVGQNPSHVPSCGAPW